MLLVLLNLAVYKKKSTKVYMQPNAYLTQPREEEWLRNIPPEELPEEPRKKPTHIPEFVSVPKFRNSEPDSVFGDVLSHSQENPFGGKDRATNAHETGHGIHSYLRNKYTSELGKKVNGFYLLQDRGAIIEEPKMRKSDIAKFIPKSLHSYRYSLYIAGQREWDDTPLYIYDEWNAYILGGKTNVDDVEKGRYKGEWVDGVSGCIDFSFYAIATAMAVKQHDPTYWNNNKQYRDFTIWNLKEAQKTYTVGHKIKWFKWDKQDALMKAFLISPDASAMRKFVAENLDGVWLDMKEAEVNLRYEPYQRELEEAVLRKHLERCSYLKVRW